MLTGLMGGGDGGAGGAPGGGGAGGMPDLSAMMAALGGMGGMGGGLGLPQPVADPDTAYATQLQQLQVRARLRDALGCVVSDGAGPTTPSRLAPYLTPSFHPPHTRIWGSSTATPTCARCRRRGATSTRRSTGS
jgi:hypothetical protein